MGPIDRSGCPARRHGTPHAYRIGCTCPDSRAVTLRYHKLKRCHMLPPGYIDATGSRRRLRALVALGHPVKSICAATGISERGIRSVMNHRGRVQAKKAAVVAKAYDVMSGTCGPSKGSAGHARARGYLPPLAWDDDTIDDPAAQPNIGGPGKGIVDEVAVQRAVNGEAGAAERLNRAERLEATRRLMRRGAGPGVVSKRLRMSGHAAAKLVGAVRASDQAA